MNPASFVILSYHPQWQYILCTIDFAIFLAFFIVRLSIMATLIPISAPANKPVENLPIFLPPCSIKFYIVYNGYYL